MKSTIPGIEIYTDGACKGNPGPGGWGAVLKYNHHEKRLRGYAEQTTNNRMELTAVIMALGAIKLKHAVLSVTTDSKYVQQGITLWLTKWKQKNWKTASGKPVKNIDLWIELDKIAQQHTIVWQWVKGHNDHPMNELADKLANAAIDDMRKDKRDNMPCAK